MNVDKKPFALKTSCGYYDRFESYEKAFKKIHTHQCGQDITNRCGQKVLDIREPVGERTITKRGDAIA